MSGASAAVLKYLTVQNRPYSANDVTQNLHKEFGKTGIQKALDELAMNNKIYEKTYGKQKVYCVIQNNNENVERSKMEAELLELDGKLSEITEKLNKSEQEVKATEATLKELQNLPTTKEASVEYQKLEDEVSKLKEKLIGLSSSTVKVSKKDKEEIKKEHEVIMKEYRKRKRISMDIVSSILENCPKSKKMLIEEIGVQTDEEVGCTLSTK